MKKKNILVTGSHRSGTTWVGRMISISPEVFYIQEPFNPNNIYGLRLENWFQFISPENEINYQENIIDLMNLNYPLWEKLKLIKSVKDIRCHAGYYRSFVINKMMQSRLLIKDPIAFFSAEWLANKFNMSVLVMIRHPLAFVGSIKKAQANNWKFNYSHLLNQPLLMSDYLAPFTKDIEKYARQFPESRIDHGILLYKIFSSITQKYREKYNNDWMFLRHEDLSMNPCDAFEIIYDKLELKYTDNLKDSIYSYSNNKKIEDSQIKLTQIKRNSVDGISSWKDRLTKAEIEKIRIETYEIAQNFYPDLSWNMSD